MARFKLLAPHPLLTARGPALFEAGAEISSADVLIELANESSLEPA
jgi:predicted DsbA family dithiol-disulfide isomerase